MAFRILLVEDEEHLLQSIQLNLELEGYEVQTAKNGKQALALYTQARYDLIVLDIMLPEMSGIEVCKEIRKINRQVFILFLSARSMGTERIEGLKAGADDYLSKPFDLEELLLRIEILLKRIPARGKQNDLHNYPIGDYTIDFENYSYSDSKGLMHPLSKKETSLLKLLIERKGQVVSRDEILEVVWGYETFPSARTIDNFIVSFRKYFEPDGAHPKYFISIRGVGYKFEG